jgi:hypothetical protein
MQEFCCEKCNGPVGPDGKCCDCGALNKKVIRWLKKFGVKAVKQIKCNPRIKSEPPKKGVELPNGGCGPEGGSSVSGPNQD